ncbi:hypothetical protein CAPTEDRAFT_104074, partial [Capitella teleta]
CYLFWREKKNWHRARAHCKYHGSHLVAMETTAEYDFVVALLLKTTPSYGVWWTAANDIARERSWKWADVNRPFTLSSKWRRGEPSNSFLGEDCGDLRRTYGFMLNDRRCSLTSEFICEYEYR